MTTSTEMKYTTHFSLLWIYLVFNVDSYILFGCIYIIFTTSRKWYLNELCVCVWAFVIDILCCSKSNSNIEFCLSIIRIYPIAQLVFGFFFRRFRCVCVSVTHFYLRFPSLTFQTNWNKIKYSVIPHRKIDSMHRIPNSNVNLNHSYRIDCQ